MDTGKTRAVVASALGVGGALLVLLTGAAMTTSLAGARSSASGAATLAPAGRAAFVPTVGNWDATLDGLHASFELVRYPHGAVYGAARYAIRDLVYQRPQTCPPSLTDPTLSAFVAFADAAPPYLLIQTGGAFPFGTTPYGSITAPTRAEMTESYLAGSAGKTCPVHLHFAFAPVSRVRVDDGTWRLTATDGSGGTFSVRGDGRIVYAIPLSSIVAHCSGTITPGSFSGSLALFVHPNGSAAETTGGNGAQMTVSLRFTSPTSATGEYLATATGCTPAALAFRATPTRG